VDGTEGRRRSRLLTWLSSVDRLLQSVRVARVCTLLWLRRSLPTGLTVMLRLLGFIGAAVLLDKGASASWVRTSRVHSSLRERISDVLLARIASLVYEG